MVIMRDNKWLFDLAGLIILISVLYIGLKRAIVFMIKIISIFILGGILTFFCGLLALLVFSLCFELVEHFDTFTCQFIFFCLWIIIEAIVGVPIGISLSNGDKS